MAIEEFEKRSKFQRKGKVRLGFKDSKGRSKSVDYFVIPEEYQKILGGKPKSLEIMFHSNDINEVMPYFYKKYASTQQLMCMSDGKKSRVFKGNKDGWKDEVCDRKTCKFALGDRPSCVMVLTFKFLIPSISMVQYFEINTRSVKSLLNIKGAIEMLKKFGGGQLIGKRLQLHTAFEKNKFGKAPVLTLSDNIPQQVKDVAEVFDGTIETVDYKTELSIFWRKVIVATGLKMTKVQQLTVFITLINQTNREQISNVNDIDDTMAKDLLDRMKPKSKKIIDWVIEHLKPKG